jgi:hypothetical protein
VKITPYSICHERSLNKPPSCGFEIRFYIYSLLRMRVPDSKAIRDIVDRSMLQFTKSMDICTLIVWLVSLSYLENNPYFQLYSSEIFLPTYKGNSQITGKYCEINPFYSLICHEIKHILKIHSYIAVILVIL